MWPFLKPAVCRVKRNNKSLPKAQDCYYVGPGIDHPHDCIRVLTANRSILTTRNVTWRHVPLSRPAPPQELPPIPEEGGSTAGEGASGERAPSQGGGGVEEVLDNESDLDDTGPMPAAAAPYCQRGGVYSGGGGVKSRRKEGARRGQRVQPRQRSGGVAPGVTRNARSASGRIRSRGSGGAEDDTPTPSASPRRGGASGRIRSRDSGGAEGNPPTPSASPGRGGASGRIRSRGSGGAEGDTPTPSVPPGRADFGGINGNSGSRVSSSSSSSRSSSRSSSSRDSSSRTSSNTSTSRGDVPTLAGREAYRQKWDGKIPALQGGRTRSQSKKHQMDADTADALLTHAWRTEEEETATERVHDLLLEEWLEKLERRGIGPRARGVRGCRVGRQGK